MALPISSDTVQSLRKKAIVEIEIPEPEIPEQENKLSGRKRPFY